MRFEHNGDRYALSFKRETRQREIGTDEQGQPILVPASKPFTTVELYKQEGDKYVLFRSATVGCWHRDDYRLEKGRLGALRVLSKGNSLSKEFKKALWNSYMNRGKA